VWLHLSVQTVRALDSLLALFQKAIATEATALEKPQLALTVMVAHEALADHRKVETQCATDQAGGL
jgi:uncharacterized protein involved in outer membrane biogenesis